MENWIDCFEIFSETNLCLTSDFVLHFRPAVEGSDGRLHKGSKGATSSVGSFSVLVSREETVFFDMSVQVKGDVGKDPF